MRRNNLEGNSKLDLVSHTGSVNEHNGTDITGLEVAVWQVPG